MSDLCQLSDLKDQLGITGTSEDIILERLIGAVSNDFVMEIKRPDFAPSVDYVEWIRHVHQSRHNVRSDQWGYGGFYGPYRNRSVTVFLEHYPVNEITKVVLNGNEIIALTTPWDPGPGYWFDDSLEDEERQKVELIDCGTGLFNLGPLNQLEVDYNGGYDEIPSTVQQAVLEWVAWRRGMGQVQQLDMSGGSVQAGTVQFQGDNIDMAVAAVEVEMPESVKRCIAQYKRVVI